MRDDLKLSPAMIHALEVTGLDDIMQGGPTRAALMRRGLVFKREGSGRFGFFTHEGRELAAKMQHAKYGTDELVSPVDVHPDASMEAHYDAEMDRRTSAQRPDPTKTGPCELKLSFACTGTGYERYDPRDMLAPETSFRTPRISCIECNDMAATIYIRELHS